MRDANPNGYPQAHATPAHRLSCAVDAEARATVTLTTRQRVVDRDHTPMTCRAYNRAYDAWKAAYLELEAAEDAMRAALA